MLKILQKTMTKNFIFLFQTYIDAKYDSKLFRKVKIIIFKKIIKSDYKILNIYRLIVLLVNNEQNVRINNN